MHFDCNHCGQRLVIDSGGVGLSIQCPQCGSALLIPPVEPQEAGPAEPLPGVTNAELAAWIEKAEGGDVEAQLFLASTYAAGPSGMHGSAEACKWFLMAAEQGASVAQYILGTACVYGKGVSQDAVEAYKWLSLAAAQGMEEAQASRDELARAMSKEQIADGQRRVAG